MTVILYIKLTDLCSDTSKEFLCMVFICTIRHRIIYDMSLSLGPLKMSLEMAHKVIVPPKKNYIPQFLKQRDINRYYIFRFYIPSIPTFLYSLHPNVSIFPPSQRFYIPSILTFLYSLHPNVSIFPPS